MIQKCCKNTILSLSSFSFPFLHRISYIHFTHTLIHQIPQTTPSNTIADEAIVMVSPPDTFKGLSQDIFHAPPEDSSFPSSNDRRRTTTLGGEDRYAVKHAIDIDAETQGFVDFCNYSDGSEFVDLGRDFELGFSEAPLTQEIDVPECSHGDSLGKIPNCQLDEFRVLERDLFDFELPEKKSKNSDLGEGLHWLVECYRKFLWLRKITLETYISQIHIWLRSGVPDGQPKFLLSLISNYPMLNFLLTSSIYVAISYRLFELTNTLKITFMLSKDNKCLTYNLITATTILVVLYSLSFIFLRIPQMLVLEFKRVYIANFYASYLWTLDTKYWAATTLKVAKGLIN